MTQGPGTYLNLVAGGNVVPMSFVKLSTTADETCLQCNAADQPIGITGVWTRYAGGTPADDGNEAIATEFPQVASVGCVVPLQCGNTGTWSAGVLLMPDAAGLGTPATGNTGYSAAMSLEAATPGIIARVLVLPPKALP